MFEACLTLPHNRREAQLIANNLDALARALREWPIEAWRTYEVPENAGLFERLVARTRPAALDPIRRTSALHSAESTASVLRVLWPIVTEASREEGLALAAR